LFDDYYRGQRREWREREYNVYRTQREVVVLIASFGLEFGVNVMIYVLLMMMQFDGVSVLSVMCVVMVMYDLRKDESGFKD
jgi:hypothetical protein